MQPWPRPEALSPPLRATHPGDWETAAFLPDFLLENPLLGRRAQLLQTLLAPRLGIHPHHWLGPGKPIANPRVITENQLQPVLADNFADLVSAELPRGGPQLLSELLHHIRRQAEVFTLRIIGTNLVTSHLQLLAQRLPPLRHHLAARK